MQATAERNNRHKYIRAPLNYNYTLCNMRQEGSLFPPSTLSLARIPQMTFSSPSMNIFFPEKSLFCQRFLVFVCQRIFVYFRAPVTVFISMTSWSFKLGGNFSSQFWKFSTRNIFLNKHKKFFKFYCISKLNQKLLSSASSIQNPFVHFKFSPLFSEC